MIRACILIVCLFLLLGTGLTQPKHVTLIKKPPPQQAGCTQSPPPKLPLFASAPSTVPVTVGWYEGFEAFRILRKIELGEPALIVALGGSFMAGTLCVEGSAMLGECCWARRVAKKLEQFSPRAGAISYVNAARGGFDTMSSVISARRLVSQIIRQDEAFKPENTLVLIDFSVNDAIANVPWRNISIALEALLLEIAAGAPGATVFGVVDACEPRRGQLCSSKVRQAYMPVFLHHEIPTIDFSMVDDFIQAQNLPRYFWKPFTGKFANDAHPSFEIHERMAEAVVTVMKRANASAPPLKPESPVSTQAHGGGGERAAVDVRNSQLPTLLWSTQDHESVPRCAQGADSFFSAFDDFAAARNASAPGYATPCLGQGSSTNCVLAEDRPNKPGWILEAKPGEPSEVRFTVNFGSHPHLVVTYLRTYAKEGSKYGDATLTMDRGVAGRAYTLSGLHAERTSVAVTESIDVQASIDQQNFASAESKLMGLNSLGSGAAFGFGIPPHSHNVQVVVRLAKGARFKVIGLVAC